MSFSFAKCYGSNEIHQDTSLHASKGRRLDSNEEDDEAKKRAMGLRDHCKMSASSGWLTSHPSAAVELGMLLPSIVAIRLCGATLDVLVLWERNSSLRYLLSDHLRIVAGLDFECAVIGP